MPKTSPLRVAILCPPWLPIPPDGYGGIEAMCATLANGLVDNGHHVVTIGSGPKKTSATHITTYPEPPHSRIGDSLPEVLHASLASKALSDLEVDIIHDHSVAGPLIARSQRVPTVLTAHHPVGTLTTFSRELTRYYEACEINLVAISQAQRNLAPNLSWVSTIYNGIPVQEIPFQSKKDGYALWLGRTTPEKGIPNAIQAARKAEIPIKLAGKYNNQAEEQYFNTIVRPLLGTDAEWIGEVRGSAKWDLLGKASCLLFPVTWEEPFGLVMIEAMATGTPVIATSRGAVPEIVDDGITGFICHDETEIISAIHKVESISPHACRKRVEKIFDIPQMVRSYETLFASIIDRSQNITGG